MNTSVYAEIFHIPVAAFGALWFLVLLFLVAYSLKKKIAYRTFVLWSGAGAGAVVYFIRAEILLGALCIYCTLVHLLLVLSLMLAIVLYRKRPSEH